MNEKFVKLKSSITVNIYTFWSYDSHRFRAIKYLSFEPNLDVHFCLTLLPQCPHVSASAWPPYPTIADVFYGWPQCDAGVDLPESELVLLLVVVVGMKGIPDAVGAVLLPVFPGPLLPALYTIFTISWCSRSLLLWRIFCLIRKSSD